MARKAKEPIQPVEDIKLVDNISDGINVIAMASELFKNKSEVIKQIGQIESLDFMKQVADLTTAQIFINIKNSKKYKDIPYFDANGNLKHVSDLEEFCKVFLNKTYRRCMQLADNLNLLGPELYEQAEKIGFKARDYQALKALPSDEQEIVKQALEAQDKESAVDLMQEMALKHKKEKELLKQQADDAKKELEISEAYNADTRKERDDLKLKLKKYELNTISIEEQIESLELSIDINKDIYKPFNRSLNSLRSIIEHFRQQTFNAMENDPDFQKGDIAKLPDIMVDQLTLYHGLLIQMLNDIRMLHYNFSDEFSAYIDDKRNDMERTAYENLMTIENEINN